MGHGRALEDLESTGTTSILNGPIVHMLIKTLCIV